MPRPRCDTRCPHDRGHAGLCADGVDRRFWRDLTWNVVIALTGRTIGIVRAPTHEQALGRAILLAAQTEYEPARLVVTRYDEPS